ncbi:Anthranilate N-methyltransferase [Linum grandiflorum]
MNFLLFTNHHRGFHSSMAATSNPIDDNKSFTNAMQLVMGSVVPMTLHAANELGIFSIMAGDSQLSASEIVSKLDSSYTMTNPDAPVMVDRILRLLATHSIVDCTLEDAGGSQKQRKYGLNSVSKYFVNNEDGVSLAPMMSLIQDKLSLDMWSELKNAVLEGGIPFNRVHGASNFEYTRLDPRFNQVLNAAMFNHTTMVMKHVLGSYKGFEQLKLVVDVGGGLGHTIKAITSKYPHIKGINFDLPHVVEHAPVIPGVEHVGGDMFQSVPQGDAIFMTNCYNATPDDGNVIVMDMVAPITPDVTDSSKLTAQIDILMMATTSGGSERTRDELVALAVGAGFKGIRFELHVCNYWVMEFYK